ncbi:MAG: hypothetical protein F4Y42_17940 [Caldilineaceae bacterium SB0664_bin_27]|uniref:Uncharacterized protein n=1 Tax=Caldilineaceae bacterium SB0664_bin_27 TaxID=2605260 RepID=A0A6B0YXH7_9CHLR|nr:hypothetical protein [Caldilineaceae bacterium SB0664_bin_27]
MEDFGSICGGAVVIFVLWAIVSKIVEGYQRSAYEEQEKMFEEWASERFSPSEVDTVNRLRKGNPFKKVKGSNWAQELIDGDRRSRQRGTSPFDKWGKEKFNDSWLATRERLCLLVSSNRTPSLDKLSDGEIKTLNDYALRDTLSEISLEPRKETEQSVQLGLEKQQCLNCGAPLINEVCIYCNTSYTQAIQ